MQARHKSGFGRIPDPVSSGRETGASVRAHLAAGDPGFPMRLPFRGRWCGGPAGETAIQARRLAGETFRFRVWAEKRRPVVILIRHQRFGI